MLYFRTAKFSGKFFSRFPRVVPGRVELPTSTLSVWRSNQLSYRTGFLIQFNLVCSDSASSFSLLSLYFCINNWRVQGSNAGIQTFDHEWSTGILQKGGVPAAPSGTATLLRLSPNHRFYPRPPLAVTDFRHPRLSWLDGRCVQGPGTYSPRHG